MDDRLEQLTHWLRGQPGLADATPVPVSGDASFRRYFRVTPNLDAVEGQRPDVNQSDTFIVMDAPPEKEDSTGFIAIARHWQSLGINVPGIHATDLQNGFMLLEDFGDELMLNHLTDASVDLLYASALKALIRIQQATDVPDYPLPSYDDALLDREMALFRDWLVEKHLGLTLSDQEHSLLETTFTLLKESALDQPQVPVHRDYHSRNLLVPGTAFAIIDGAELGIIDFQDAVYGPITYDLVSLVKDCYIRWPQAQVNAWTETFRQAAASVNLHNADAETFRQWMELMGMQRHLKASGIFARLALRDGKAKFLDDIPRTLGYLLDASSHQPALRHFHDWLNARVVPALEESRQP